MPSSQEKVATLLATIEDVNQGVQQLRAKEKLSTIVYQELRKMARRKVTHEKPGFSLTPSDLVHEAYLKLFPDVQDLKARRAFFAAAANAMEQVLIDHSRRKNAIKRGGGWVRVCVSLTPLMDPRARQAPTTDILALGDALSKLKSEDPRIAELVRLKFFCGLTNEEAAEMLGVSRSTIEARWRFARAWIQREIEKS